jgi:HK97 family phage portal protein
MGQVLQTIDGQLLESAGPFQVTQDGMESIARSSTPFAAWMGGAQLVQLIGEGRTISYTRLYETQPWVAIAVNKLSRQISRLPLKVYTVDSQGNRERVREGALVDLLGRPRTRSGPIQLKQSIVFPMLLHGNSLLEKIRDGVGKPPRALWPLDWRFIQGYLPYQGAVDFEAYGSTQTGQSRYVEADDTLHFRWESPDGLLGSSPLMQLGVTIAAEDAAQRYIQALHKNGARPSFAVVIPPDARADKEVRDGIRQEIQDVHGGVDKALQAPIIGGGADVKPLAQTAHEAELIEQRKLNREEVAAVYDIPPPLIGILDHATYSNVAEMHRMLYGTVLGPWLTLIEETLQAQLIDTEPAFEGCSSSSTSPRSCAATARTSLRSSTS